MKQKLLTKPEPPRRRVVLFYYFDKAKRITMTEKATTRPMTDSEFKPWLKERMKKNTGSFCYSVLR